MVHKEVNSGVHSAAINSEIRTVLFLQRTCRHTIILKEIKLHMLIVYFVLTNFNESFTCAGVELRR